MLGVHALQAAVGLLEGVQGCSMGLFAEHISESYLDLPFSMTGRFAAGEMGLEEDVLHQA